MCVWVLFSVRACAVVLAVQCVVRETVENLAGFQRVYGCAQHVTLGESFLTGGCQFAANFDRVRCVRLRACARPLVRVTELFTVHEWECVTPCVSFFLGHGVRLVHTCAHVRLGRVLSCPCTARANLGACVC